MFNLIGILSMWYNRRRKNLALINIRCEYCMHQIGARNRLQVFEFCNRVPRASNANSRFASSSELFKLTDTLSTSSFFLRVTLSRCRMNLLAVKYASCRTYAYGRNWHFEVKCCILKESLNFELLSRFVPYVAY